jgi:hypothetical protein
MLLFSRRYFEPFKSISWTSFSLKFLKLFVFFALLLSTGIAHSFDVSFAWDANTEPDLAGYRVFARQAGQDYDYNNPDWEGTETTCTLYGLNDNKTYYFVSRAYDIYGNESEDSVELISTDSGASVTPVGDGGGGGGGGCFIATAAFGSLIEPHVKLLRQFRDRFLLTNAPGKVFVRLYYTYSPPIADVIAAHGSLRLIVRWSLLPLIVLSWMLLHLGVLCTLLFTSTGLGLPIILWVRKTRSGKQTHTGLDV